MSKDRFGEAGKDHIRIGGYQILGITAAAILVGSSAVWLASNLPPAWGMAFAAMAGFAGLFSLVRWGDTERWVVLAGHWIFRTTLSTNMRSVVAGSVATSLAAAVCVDLYADSLRPNFSIEVRENGLPRAAVIVRLEKLYIDEIEEAASDKNGIASFHIPSKAHVRWSILVERNGSLNRYIALAQIADPPQSISKEIATIEETDWREERGPNAPAPITVTKLKLGPTDTPGQIVGLQTSQFLPALADPENSRNLVPWGYPEAPILISREDSLVGFDPNLRVPRWVITQFDAKAPRLDVVRTPYRPDPLIPSDTQAGNVDYRKSGFDRGNLLSTSDMAYVSEEAIRSSFYLSTIVPQAPENNRRAWYALERYAREASANFGLIWVIAGPVFEQTAQDELTFISIGENKVAVPSSLFRILIRQDQSGTPVVLAFLVSNNAQLGADPREFLTSIDQIERLTGLNFFPHLPESEANVIKRIHPSELW